MKRGAYSLTAVSPDGFRIVDRKRKGGERS